MNNNEKKSNVTLSINYIKEVSFIIKESLVLKEEQLGEKDKDILVQMTGLAGYNIEQNILKFTLKAWFHYKDNDTELAAIEVENLFDIEDITNFITSDKKIDLPQEVWVNIVALSISHTRALFTKNLAGSILQKVMIPIMNPYDVAQHYFPESFAKKEAAVVNQIDS